LVLNVLSQDHL